MMPQLQQSGSSSSPVFKPATATLLHSPCQSEGEAAEEGETIAVATVGTMRLYTGYLLVESMSICFNLIPSRPHLLPIPCARVCCPSLQQPKADDEAPLQQPKADGEASPLLRQALLNRAKNHVRTCFFCATLAPTSPATAMYTMLTV